MDKFITVVVFGIVGFIATSAAQRRQTMKSVKRKQ